MLSLTGRSGPVGSRVRQPPIAFEAFEETAAYITADLSRAQAITEARNVCHALAEDFRRRDLRAIRVYLRPVEGQEADEFFCGEFDSGWIEVSHRPLNAAQIAGLIPMWKVEPK
jgi:hypothetical protein